MPARGRNAWQRLSVIHPHTELRLIDPVVGYGVFATQDIPAGTLTYVKDSLEIVVAPAEYDRHAPEMRGAIDKYSYIDERGNRIVSWDFAKYVNHCCDCNTISTGYGFEIAIRDIRAGEQLTDEYGIFNLEEPMTLVCDSPLCRGCIRPEDFDTHYRAWDAKILRALPRFADVEQPLLPFVDPATRAAVDRYLAAPETYRSVYALRLRERVPSGAEE